ncbi:MAG: hypothetical protein E7321_09440 [Clostridiales bacterium]|nr:hypothetical protein [Clostridiales bacterium]
MNRRILAFVLSAVMLLMPGMSVAEEAVSNYYAGELTAIAIGDSYAAGNQLNLNAVLGLDLDETVTDEALLALSDLLSKTKLHMSFYDDFGTARIHAQLDVDDVMLLGADALVYEDGSVQAMSNLTGKLVLAMPASSGQAGTGMTMADFDMNTPEGVAAFRELPATERLAITGSDMISLLINHLLGWVSYMQVDNDGEFYTFDDTYLDATEVRDPVAQRMHGKIKADSFNTLLWNIATSVADTTGEFQLALADVLAEHGVTRYQARMLTDALFTKETIDPALDYVQPSFYIIESKDESPITYDDVAYFFKKLQKCTQRIWDTGTDEVMTMTVSYDDFGAMVGFDAFVPQFTTELPYEGDFTYSIKTDDDWQRFHTSHGELQVYNDNRVVGDLDIQFGQDVGGVNHSHFVGQADVLDQNAGTSVGFGVDANLDFAVSVGDNGEESETFEGMLLLNGRQSGENNALVSATFSGMTTVDAETFAMSATGALGMNGAGMLVADMTLEQGEYEDIDFAGGQAINLSALDDAQKELLTKEIVAQAAKLSLSLMTKPDVLSDLMTIFGGMAMK